jgi:hypothetical protein
MVRFRFDAAHLFPESFEENNPVHFNNPVRGQNYRVNKFGLGPHKDGEYGSQYKTILCQIFQEVLKGQSRYR